MIDSLQKLFGSVSRVKLMRLFLFNPKQHFTVAEVALRARVSEKEVRSEIAVFIRAELLSRSVRDKKTRFTLNDKFSYILALQNLLLNAPAAGSEIHSRIRSTGVIKFIALAGIFMGEWEGTIDVLIVGDKVRERELIKSIHQLESEMGKELRYALLTSEDFMYRVNMNDKLVRDVLDYPHKVVLNKLSYQQSSSL